MIPLCLQGTALWTHASVCAKTFNMRLVFCGCRWAVEMQRATQRRLSIPAVFKVWPPDFKVWPLKAVRHCVSCAVVSDIPQAC